VVEMQEWLMARAARLAVAAGAELVVMAAPVLDETDRDLVLVGHDLLARAEAAGVQVLALHREGARLHVLLDDSRAEEPLSPGALQSAIRQISWHRLGQVWDAVLHAVIIQAPYPAAPVQAPTPSPTTEERPAA
jgi:hypothetical protein